MTTSTQRKGLSVTTAIQLTHAVKTDGSQEIGNTESSVIAISQVPAYFEKYITGYAKDVHAKFINVSWSETHQVMHVWYRVGDKTDFVQVYWKFVEVYS